MTSTRNIGRIVGVLVLAHMAGGLILPYILLNRVIQSSDWVNTAAQNALAVRAPVFLFLFAGAVTLGISIAAYPVVQQSRPRLGLLLFALSVANLTLQVIEGGLVLSMLSLSQDYMNAGTGQATVRATAEAVGTLRAWAHFTQLLTVVSWIFVLFTALWRARLIPGALAIFGLVTSALQIVGVPLLTMLGQVTRTELAIPLAPAYAGLGLWLIVKGFK